MSDWRVVYRLRDIPVQGSRSVATPMGDIAVFRSSDDRVIAVEDRDIAERGILAQAVLQAMTAIGSAFTAEIGGSRRFNVQVADGLILLDVDGMGFERLAH